MTQVTKSRTATRMMTLWAALFLLAAEHAGAGVVRSFSELKAKVRQGDVLHVLDTSGKEWTGPLVEVTDQSIVLTVQGARRSIDRATVRRVEKDGDSVRNGAVTGAAVGSGIGLISGCREGIAVCVVGGALIYGGIGILVDFFKKGRTRLYEVP